MSINIKDPEAHELAKALARETGETITGAVIEALRERLHRLRRERRSEMMVADLLALGRRCARTLKRNSVDHAELLYDEHGIPR